MADVYLLGQADDLATLTPEDSPDTVALCLQTGPLDQEARLPLYALMHGLVLDDAKSFEYLDRALSEEGPYLMGVDDRFPDLLAGLEESELEATVDHWHACAAVEAACMRRRCNIGLPCMAILTRPPCMQWLSIAGRPACNGYLTQAALHAMTI